MKKLFFLAVLCLSVFLLTAQDINNYNVYKTPNMEIIALSEVQNQNTPSILIGATEDMIKEYIPDGEFPAAINAFLVKTQGKNILFDTGVGIRLTDLLNEIGVAPEDIDYIFITHMHGDHIGGMLKDGNVAYPNAEVNIALPEFNYWMNETELNELPESKRESFEMVRNIMQEYEGKIHHFQPGDFIYPTKLLFDILAIEAYGHTPGHTIFLLNDGDEQILIWGDLTHAMAIQMAHPEVAVTYDVSPAQAIESRKKVLEYIKDKNIVIGGMHIPFPCMGKVSEIKADSYKFTPVNR